MFSVNQGWQVLLNKAGINTGQLLSQCQLPGDLFIRKDAGLTPLQYFRLWTELGQRVGAPELALKIIQGINTDVFEPSIFASYCSPNLTVALERLSKFKPLIGPMQLDVFTQPEHTQIVLRYLNVPDQIPQILAAIEIGFFVQLSRLATKELIVPLQVVSPVNLGEFKEMTQFLGITPTDGENISISFSSKDVAKPFVSENIQMWNFFEPTLRKCLDEITQETSFQEVAKSALLEMLPSGQVTADELSQKLLVSKRTLQRRLSDEGTSFKTVLASVRKNLAKHYITQSELPYSQISFLLGYEDPNSFFRAFNAWTGSSPDNYRKQN